MSAAIAYVIANWHRHEKVVSINRAWDYRRARWMQTHTRPFNPPQNAA